MSGIDGRMLDLSAYSTNTLNTFSFISTYFIDLFYNHLYSQAVRFHRNKQVGTITDGYKASLDAFLQSIKKSDKELYRDMVHGIHQTFIDYGFKGMTYENCIDRIVKEFVPQDYWKVISFDDKSKILGIIITNSTQEMIHKIITSHLSDVIDNHGEVENANIWQDEYINILIMEREKLFQQIINAKTNGGSNGLAEAMGKEILLLSKQKNELKQECHLLKKKLLSLQKLVLTLSKTNKEAAMKISELEAAKTPIIESEFMSNNNELQEPTVEESEFMGNSEEPEIIDSNDYEEQQADIDLDNLVEQINTSATSLSIDDDDLYTLDD